MSEIPEIKLSLWSDDPALTDLLSFDAVAQTVADALLDDALDPVALGLSGSWGSGKTTVLNLVAAELQQRSSETKKIVVVQTDPWRYDPATGAKESFIAEVLAALAAEMDRSATKTDKAKELLARLSKRIDWAKAVKLVATSSITLQIPKVQDLVDLVRPSDDPDGVRGLEAFRDEFAALINSEDLGHVRTVVVLVDDLDRCLPPTVVESLEAMRLFLAVPKMSFVIAADEDRVADAIRSHFKITGTPEEDGGNTAEDPAHLYLHKIVQTAIPLPALGHFDTQSYLLLLQMQAKSSETQLSTLIASCGEVRRRGGNVDEIPAIDGLSFVDELAFASRLTPLLYEKLRGNPRRIKRFLNDLHVRQSVATRRGIRLDPAVVAKLMTLEVLMPKDFEQVLDWLGKGVLRDQLTKLEVEAGRQAQPPDGLPAPPPAEGNGIKPSQTKKPAAQPKDTPGSSGEFSQPMIRWAKLFPSLQSTDLSSYLTLAASFAGVTLVDDSLPERLRDIAVNLLSESRAEQAAVRDADLDALGDGDAKDLLLHIGRAMRDQPSKQKAGVNAVLRMARRRMSLARAAGEALRMLPPSELSAATPVQFRADDPQDVRAVLTTWKAKIPSGPIGRALDNALAQRVGS